MGRRRNLRPHALSDTPADDPCILVLSLVAKQLMVVVRIRKPAVTGPLQVVIRVVQNRFIKILICCPYSFTIEVVGRS